MLCYRCGSYTPDEGLHCAVCGQPITARRRTTRVTGQELTRPVLGPPPYSLGSLIAGRYRVTDTAGSGTTGWVLRARDEEIDVEVAVKVVAPSLVQDESERDQFVAAIRAAREVHHANLVRIYDGGADGTQLFYTMPYLEGLSLRKVIDVRLEKGVAFGPSEVLPLANQLSQALDTLRETFGPHGALRPCNVMVLPDMLKITGVPHYRGAPRHRFVPLQTQCGCAEYLAPEARLDDGTIDSRADVYSLAVIFAEMITGVTYGRDETAWAAARRNLPARLAAVLQEGALAQSPAVRFATAGQLFTSLIDAVADAPAAPARLATEETTPVAGNGVEQSRASATAVAGAVVQARAPLATVRHDEERRRLRPWMALAATAVVVAGVTAFAAARWRQRAVVSPTPAALAVPADEEAQPSPTPIPAAPSEPTVDDAPIQSPEVSPQRPARAATRASATRPGRRGKPGAQSPEPEEEPAPHAAAAQSIRAAQPVSNWAATRSNRTAEALPAPDKKDAAGAAGARESLPGDAVVYGPSGAPITPPADAMTWPVYASGPNPEYTREALDRQVEGVMTVKCIVTAEGEVRYCRVLKSVPFMDKAVTKALEARRYKPATFRGQPVTVEYTFTIRLVLPK